MTCSSAAHRPLRRRTLLTGIVGMSAGGVLAACTEHPAPHQRTPSAPAPTTTTPKPSPSVLAGPDSWDGLAAALGSRLLRADSAGWATATQLQNPRWDGANPLGVALVANADDVRTCIAFARRTGTPLAVRAGGHSYTGWSAGGAPGTNVAPSLVVNTGQLNAVTLSDDQEHVTVGPGATLIAVYRALAGAGRAIGAGSCPTVGVGGLTLGGGIGVLSRSFGLTCDQLRSVQIVTADGTVRTASATEHPDLFWACRGGSGGTVGIVTAMTFTTRPAPTITRFTLTFPWNAAPNVVQAWQDWAPDADDQLWSTLKLLNGSRYPTGPAVTVTGTWIGSPTSLDAQLSPFLTAVGTTPTTREVVTADYGTTMDAFAGTTGIPTEACTTGPSGKLSRVPEAATSHIGMHALPAADIATLISHVEQAGTVAGLRDGGVSLDALGGAIGRIPADQTAFPWRGARYDVQYTAVFDTGTNPAAYDAYVRGFRAAMQGGWGDTGYSNYVDSAITTARTYFGANTEQMQDVINDYDAHTLFRQPNWL